MVQLCYLVCSGVHFLCTVGAHFCRVYAEISVKTLTCTYMYGPWILENYHRAPFRMPCVFLRGPKPSVFVVSGSGRARADIFEDCPQEDPRDAHFLLRNEPILFSPEVACCLVVPDSFWLFVGNLKIWMAADHFFLKMWLLSRMFFFWKVCWPIPFWCLSDLIQLGFLQACFFFQSPIFQVRPMNLVRDKVLSVLCVVKGLIVSAILPCRYIRLVIAACLYICLQIKKMFLMLMSFSKKQYPSTFSRFLFFNFFPFHIVFLIHLSYFAYLPTSLQMHVYVLPFCIFPDQLAPVIRVFSRTWDTYVFC